MKKTIAILLVAILAVSSVFAAFSGKASIGAGVNLDNGNYGFIDQSTNAKIDLELATANAENVGEGDIYASIKASLVVRLFNGEKGATPDKPNNQNGKWLPVDVAIDEAKVGGENWYVSILGMPDGPDYAKSAIDTYDVKKKVDDYGFEKADFTGNYSFSVPYADTNGIELGLFGYKFGFGLLGDADDERDIPNWKFEDHINFAVFAETPEYDFNGLTLQAAATYSYKSFDKFYLHGVTAPGVGDNVDSDIGIRDNVDPAIGADMTGYTGFSKTNAIGVAAKVGFANDTLSASVATDMGFNLEGDKFEEVFDMDVAANFNWSFLTLDAYYATTAKSGEASDAAWDVAYDDDGTYTVKGNKWGNTYKDDVLSAQVKFDLNAFEVPVALTASVKDVLHTVELGLKAEVTPVEGLKITANGGYVIDTIDAYSKAAWYKDTVKNYDPLTTPWQAEYVYRFLSSMGSVGLNSSDKDINKAFNDATKGVFLGQWKFGLDAEYDFGFAKVAAGVSLKNAGFKSAMSDTFDYDMHDDYVKKDFKEAKDVANYFVNKVVLGASASVSTTSIIPGAELKLAWENGDDLLKVFQYSAADEVYNYGKITASCTIEF